MHLGSGLRTRAGIGYPHISSPSRQHRRQSRVFNLGGHPRKVGQVDCSRVCGNREMSDQKPSANYGLSFWRGASD